MKKLGIDISKWQGSVDFAKVKAAGIQFAILRTGYSKTVDAKFHEYVRGCKSVGIPVVGVYHFSYALNVDQVIQEAEFCINQIQKAGLGKNVIVFYDFEYDTVEKAIKKGVNLGSKECNAHTKAFCEYVESKGYKAGIYANIDYYKRMYEKDLLNKYVFWLADYTGSADYPCAFQQYSSKGQVSGINGNVDMNYWFTTEAKKPIEEVAKEVIEGKYGSGEARKSALKAAGYDYSKVQKKVNEILSEKATLKSVTEIAKEVIAGKWGTGSTRKQKLEASGYNYSAVQKKVNELLR